MHHVVSYYGNKSLCSIIHQSEFEGKTLLLKAYTTNISNNVRNIKSVMRTSVLYKVHAIMDLNEILPTLPKRKTESFF